MLGSVKSHRKAKVKLTMHILRSLLNLNLIICVFNLSSLLRSPLWFAQGWPVVATFTAVLFANFLLPAAILVLHSSTAYVRRKLRLPQMGRHSVIGTVRSFHVAMQFVRALESGRLAMHAENAANTRFAIKGCTIRFAD